MEREGLEWGADGRLGCFPTRNSGIVVSWNVSVSNNLWLNKIQSETQFCPAENLSPSVLDLTPLIRHDPDYNCEASTGSRLFEAEPLDQRSEWTFSMRPIARYDQSKKTSTIGFASLAQYMRYIQGPW